MGWGRRGSFDGLGAMVERMAFSDEKK